MNYISLWNNMMILTFKAKISTLLCSLFFSLVFTSAFLSFTITWNKSTFQYSIELLCTTLWLYVNCLFVCYLSFFCVTCMFAKISHLFFLNETSFLAFCLFLFCYCPASVVSLFFLFSSCLPCFFVPFFLCTYVLLLFSSFLALFVCLVSFSLA